MTTEDIKKNFIRPDLTDNNEPTIHEIEKYFYTLAIYLNEALPDSRLKSIAMTKLEESCMFAIKSITHK